MRILQVNTRDRGGGAERVALDLHRSYLAAGHDARLLVGYRDTREPGVIEADAYAFGLPWARLCRGLDRWMARQRYLRSRDRLRFWLRRAARPTRWFDRWRGVEDFDYPFSHRLLDGSSWRPDVIQMHNLHGDYFDLSALVALSREVPVVWTLHDTWAFSGHCAYFMDCQRWRSGCGDCPDLRRPPALLHDGTARNWRRKAEIYAASRLAVAAPSRWLLACTKESILEPQEARLVPNGVDLAVYRPGQRLAARQALGLPPEAFICLFVAHRSRNYVYKDLNTAQEAVRRLAQERSSAAVELVCIGDSVTSRDEPHWHYTGQITEPQHVATYYQAADVLLHAARAENLPLVILEAQACGTPVIATAVGGIPEALVDGETGFLVPPGDSAAMAARMQDLARDPAAHERMRMAAAEHARRNFDLRKQVATYLCWFSDLRQAHGGERP